jgi:hypothetical protein
MVTSMNQTFRTQPMFVVIETLSYAGSAFGVNAQGEQVFINARIVEKCRLEEGMEVVARVLPNYEDKRNSIPWRAMRVDQDPVDGEPVAPAPVPAVAPQDLPANNDERVYNYIDDGGYCTTADISEALEMDSRTVNNSCNRLFNGGRIAKAEVFSGPNQTRASFLLWARSAKHFVEC